MKVVIFPESQLENMEKKINDYIGNKKVVNVSVTPDENHGYYATILIDTTN